MNFALFAPAGPLDKAIPVLQLSLAIMRNVWMLGLTGALHVGHDALPMPIAH